MVNDNSYPEDYFDGSNQDELKKKIDEFLKGFNNESDEDIHNDFEPFETFEDFLNESEKEEGLDRLDMFQDLLNKYFEGDDINSPLKHGGKLISSTIVTKNNESYREETWQFDNVQVTRVFIDIEKPVEQKEKEDENKYIDYLYSTLEDIKEQIKMFVAKEDYEKAAELKSRIKMIEQFILNSKK